MSILRLDRLLEFLTSIELLMALLWLGLAIFTLALAILMYTRWGQYKPLRKCMALSLLAHLLLAGYAATVQIITPIVVPAEPVVHVTLGDGPDQRVSPGGSAPLLSKAKEQPWEIFPAEPVAPPAGAALERGKADRPAEPQRLLRTQDAKLAGRPGVEHVAMAEAKLLSPRTTAVVQAANRSTPGEGAAAIEAPAAQHRDAVPVLPALPPEEPPQRLANDGPSTPARTTLSDIPAALLEQIVPLPRMTDANTIEPVGPAAGSANAMRLKPVEHVAGKVLADAAYSDAGQAAATPPNTPGSGSGAAAGAAMVASNTPKLGLPGTGRTGGDEAQKSVPDAYRLRVAPDRDGVAQSHGGTSDTEAAVKAALRWLANSQSADGRWDPRTHESGKENNVAGRNRQGAGSRADTALTGLALLAFLGAGHTHVDGPYRDDVRRGLDFLMQTQAPDGNLGGRAAVFEFMYCHAMATCAVSEAYGMTHDQRLRETVRRAIGYTIAAQDPKGGGWRYRPGDAGDTSQLGWQLMALKSADLAGISMPEPTRQGIMRYLQSVSSGRYGGRASYRPGEPATRSMTAEALVCWQFLGLAREHPACDEAADFLVGELPGEGPYNLYYWYYATLGMYQLQGDRWQRWNDALRATLVSRQIKDAGPRAGSWDTTDLWGGYGGRVYTTAVATLTLEVYYRFLPLYGGVSPAKVTAR